MWKSKIKQMLEKFSNDTSVWILIFNQSTKIIHVLCLMNIVLTSNIIIRLQMIGNLGDNYETWWKRQNSTHAHSPKAINNTWTNMYTELWKMKTFVNTLSLLLIILSEFMAHKFAGSRLLMLSNIWEGSLKGMDTSFIRF